MSVVLMTYIKTFFRNNWLILLYLSAVFLWSFNSLKEYDAWYHLKTGKLILDTFAIPQSDIFSYTAGGADWVTHSWLAEVIFAAAYDLFGLAGLIGFVALVGVLAYFLAFRLAMFLGANKYIALFSLLFLPFLRVFPFFVPRPQIFSYLFVVLEILLLEKYLETKRRAYVYAILGILLLWANMHASVVLGIILLLGYAFFARELFIPGFFSIALALANPNTYRVFTYQFEIREVAQALRVGEWISIWAYRDFLGTQIFFAGLLLLNAFFIAAYAKKPSAQNLRNAGLALVFSALPFVSVRHIAFFPLVVLPFFAAELSRTSTIRNALQKIRPALLVAIVAAAGAVFAVGGYVRLPQSLIREGVFPVAAADFIEVNGIRGPLFNLYHEGGYLIWRFWPKEKVFFDGRSEVYRGAPLADFLAISHQRDGWRDLVDKKYRINYFLLPYREPYTGFSMQLARSLLGIDFRVVYIDETHIILLRDAPENRDIIRRFAIEL